MDKKNRFIAKVIDNNDLDQEGKVQIYIEQLHHGLTSTYYPWAKQDREWTSNIPEIGDYIWVWFEKLELHKYPFYCNKVNLKDYHEHAETIGSITGSYPDIKYMKFNNGISIAINSNASTPEISIFHSSNVEIYIDSSGIIEIKSGSVATEKMLLGETTNQFLSDLIDGILALTVTSSAPGNPSSVPINAATFTALKNSLSTLLSTNVKNN